MNTLSRRFGCLVLTLVFEFLTFKAAKNKALLNAIYSVCIAAVATTHSFTSYERMILWNLLPVAKVVFLFDIGK